MNAVVDQSRRVESREEVKKYVGGGREGVWEGVVVAGGAKADVEEGTGDGNGVTNRFDCNVEEDDEEEWLEDEAVRDDDAIVVDRDGGGVEDDNGEGPVTK